MDSFQKEAATQKGQAILLGMIFLALATLVYFSVFSRIKIIKNNLIQADGDQEIEAASQKIMAILLTPSHCNANFTGAALSGTLSTIYACTAGTTGDCISGGLPTNRANAVDVYTSGWRYRLTPANPFQYTSNSTNLSSKVRLAGVSYSIYRAQKCSINSSLTSCPAIYTNGDHGVPAKLRVTLTFQRRLNPEGDKFSTTKKSIDIFVVTDQSPGTPIPADDYYYPATQPYGSDATKIIGCPVTPTTITVY